MTKNRINKAYGTDLWYNTLQLAQNANSNLGSQTATNASQSGGREGRSGSRNGSSIWNSLLDRASDIISSVTGGIANITMAKTGNYPTIQEDNTPKVLAIAGVGAIVLIIILVIIFKK